MRLAGNGLGQNGYGAGYLGEYTLTAALIFEVVMTFIFVTVILGATAKGAPAAMAGSGHRPDAGGDPPGRHQRDRRFGEPGAVDRAGVFVGGTALAHLWVFIVAPLAGGALAGMVHAAGLTRAD